MLTRVSPLTTPTTPAAPAPPLAQVMAGMPEVWRTLLVAHVADRFGHCTTCRHSVSGSAQRWPCNLHRIATEAQRVAEAG